MKHPEKRTGLLISAFAGTFMALLDLSIVNVALPKIESDLHTDVTGTQWIVDGFAVCLAAFMLSGGSLGDRYGRKRLYLTGIAGFLAGSVLCAIAANVGELVAGRAVQGIMAALVIPGALSIIGQAEPDPAKRARVLGYWGMSASSAVVLGPIVGGLLADGLGWPSIFLVNLPIGLMAIGFGARAIPESKDPDHTSLDPLGQVLAICALGTLSYGVIGTRQEGWDSPVTITLLLAGAIAGALFTAVERTSDRPMLPVGLFADRRFTIVNIASTALGFGANGAFFLLILFLQQVQGHSARVTGLLLLPMTLALVPASIAAGRLTARYGPQLPLRSGTHSPASGWPPWRC